MKAIGLILAGGNSRRLEDLSNKRAVAAMPIAGQYRAVDFALSNMTNSGIQKVAVLTQYNSRSLNEHLNSSKWWNFGRKHGGLFLFTPTITPHHADWYRGTIDSIYQNINFLTHSHEPYVVIAQGDGIYNMDYSKLIEYHIEKNADITVVCKNMEEIDDITRYGVVTTNADGRIIELEEKPVESDNRFINCGIYIVRRRLLIELIEKAAIEGKMDFVNDILVRYRHYKKIFAYDYKGYWNNVGSIESYYKTNMDFLKPEVRDIFLNSDRDIYTKTEDYPPAKYNEGCRVGNSLVASGTIINGVVENSVISRKVYIGNNCVIRNSVILHETYIGDGTVVENCIVESRSTLPANKEYRAEQGEIKVVIEKGERYSI